MTTTYENTTFDIIGDVHGHIDKLEDLLTNLGYEQTSSGWSKQNHIAVFVGDLIDKGPSPAAVLNTVVSMVENKNALMVIGNHELNWINDAAHYTHDIEQFFAATNKHYDRYSITEEFSDDPGQLISVFNWLREQPLYIDLPNLRAVHACWNQEAIELLQQSGITCMDDNALDAYKERYSDLYLAIDLVVAGCMHTFPKEPIKYSSFRSIRQRICWFPLTTVRINPIELQPIAVEHPPYPQDAAPVFFGHYALDGEPDLLAENVVGVDFSAAYDGSLIAYRLLPNTVLHKQYFYISKAF